MRKRLRKAVYSSDESDFQENDNFDLSLYLARCLTIRNQDVVIFFNVKAFYVIPSKRKPRKSLDQKLGTR